MASHHVVLWYNATFSVSHCISFYCILQHLAMSVMFYDTTLFNTTVAQKIRIENRIQCFHSTLEIVHFTIVAYGGPGRRFADVENFRSGLRVLVTNRSATNCSSQASLCLLLVGICMACVRDLIRKPSPGSALFSAPKPQSNRTKASTPTMYKPCAQSVQLQPLKP